MNRTGIRTLIPGNLTWLTSDSYQLHGWQQDSQNPGAGGPREPGDGFLL